MASKGDAPVQKSDEEEKFTFFWQSQSPFSQWHPSEFKADGITFCCCEQYMMYQKAILFGDGEAAQKILDTSEPREQKAIGRTVRNFDDKVWKENCRDIVKRGNKAKFTQNKDLKEKLMSTVGTTLVEASPRDRIWGIGLGASNPKALNRKTWRGTNWLGQAITELMSFDRPYSLGLYGDGYVIYYKDNRETMKELTDKERSEIQEAEEARLKRIRECKSQHR